MISRKIIDEFKYSAISQKTSFTVAILFFFRYCILKEILFTPIDISFVLDI